MTDFRQQTLAALAATRITTGATHTWFGVPSPPLAPSVQKSIDPQSARAYLIYSLQGRLYADFYCPGGARPSVADPVPYATPGTSPFVELLSEANTGAGAREPGWTVVRHDGDAVVVARAGLSLWASPHLVYPADGSALAQGASVGVLMPNELRRLSPGFYMALGECEFPVDGSAPLVRFYWNLRSDGAPRLVGFLTRALNTAHIPFRLKVVNEPVRYSRCDAGVLYVQATDYEQVIAVVAQAHSRIGTVLKPSTPALTKALAPGLGLAEDPGGHLESFGMSRCRMLAEAIVRSSEQALTNPDQRLSVVERVFAEAGLSIDAPYLGPGSRDRYGFPAAS